MAKTKFWFWGLFFLATPVFAKSSIPVRDTALDGGAVSAESLARGGTFASNHDSPASGSENPSAFLKSTQASAYSTFMVRTSTALSDKNSDVHDPLTGKNLQYLSFGSGQGVVFFEPLARLREDQITDVSTPQTDYREVSFSADAIGFAAADKWNGGGIGMSLAYLRSSLATVDHRTGQPDHSSLDTGDGVRLNIGTRIPVGPVMSAFTAQNAPAFLWWKNHRRTQLPLKFRWGNTYKAAPGILFSVDLERRYYHEGSHVEDWVYVGNESYLSKFISIRAGVFADNLGKPESRHWTGGIGYQAATGFEISYALENLEVSPNERINRSIVSVRLPLKTAGNDNQEQ